MNTVQKMRWCLAVVGCWAVAEQSTAESPLPALPIPAPPAPVRVAPPDSPSQLAPVVRLSAVPDVPRSATILPVELRSPTATPVRTVAEKSPLPPPKIDLPIPASPTPIRVSLPDAPAIALPAELPPSAPRIATPVESRPATVASEPVGTHSETCGCSTCSTKRTLREKCTTTPQGFPRAKTIPPTQATAHGSVVRGIFDRQKQLALDEYFVVYREDFLENTAELNATGLRHTNGIFKRLDMTAAPIKVETTGLPGLDDKRRSAVIEALVQLGAGSSISLRVQAGTTRAEGLRYEDVLIVGSSNPLGSGGNGSSGGGQNGGGTGGFGGGGGGGGFGGGGGGFR